ncbi:MAG: AIR synthase-related protein [Candidatus Bathyarchaeota archaeon]|nr:AIR synthase-related protein [Candidatus Bathyarchaeota archaeon]
MGKLQNRELQKLLSCIRKDERVLVPPMVGYDAGVHRIGDRYLVVSTDPCTGVPKDWFGWLLINYASNDVALFGAKPEFCTINLLGPRHTKPEVFQDIMKQTCRAANELGIAIVRGHTGMYDSLKDMLGVCTVYGTVTPERLITSGNAKAGDIILCTKPLGLETATNFSIAHGVLAQKLFGVEKQQELASLVKMQSCVREALLLTEVGGVHAMHDATEGGFVAAMNELAEASKLGFRIDFASIPVLPEALLLKERFGLSDEEVLAMSSTGTILASVDPSARRKVEGALREIGLSPFFIGEFTEDLVRVMVRDNGEAAFPSQADDPYTKIIANSAIF